MNFGFLTECYVKEGKSHAQAFADTFDQVDHAEALGMDSIWMVEQLQEFRDRMGVTGFLLDLNFGGQISQELVLNSMRLLSEKVMPSFK